MRFDSTLPSVLNVLASLGSNQQSVESLTKFHVLFGQTMTKLVHWNDFAKTSLLHHCTDVVDDSKIYERYTFFLLSGK